MRIVAGTYEGFCYGWESGPEPAVGAAATTPAAGLPTGTTKEQSKGLEASQQQQSSATATAAPQPLSVVFGYNVHVGCMKSVAMATSGTRAGQLLVTGGVDERVRIYDLRDRTELGELQQHNGAHSSRRSGGYTCRGWEKALQSLRYRVLVAPLSRTRPGATACRTSVVWSWRRSSCISLLSVLLLDLQPTNMRRNHLLRPYMYIIFVDVYHIIHM